MSQYGLGMGPNPLGEVPQLIVLAHYFLAQRLRLLHALPSASDKKEREEVGGKWTYTVLS